MKAAVCWRPTSLGALRITETAVPEDRLLVRVRASSADPIDLCALTLVTHCSAARAGGAYFATLVAETGS